MWTSVEVFGSWTVGWSNCLNFWGVGKDSFSREHTLASQTSFLNARSTRRTFPSVGGVQGHRLVCSLDAVMHPTPLEPPGDFTWTLYFTWMTLLVFLLPGLFGFDWTNYKVALQVSPWVTSRKGQSGAGLYISPHIPVWDSAAWWVSMNLSQKTAWVQSLALPLTVARWCYLLLVFPQLQHGNYGRPSLAELWGLNEVMDVKY